MLRLPMLLALLALSLVSPAASDDRVRGAADPKGAIRPSPAHPFYWEFGSRPVLLLGGSDDDNLFQWPDEALRTQLDRLVEAGGNYLRNTMSDRRDAGFEVYPFLQLPDGRFDLEKWNPEYWRRFERFLRWTADRRIAVQIEIWDRFDYSRAHWPPHPYNPQTNVNYTSVGAGLATEYPQHPGANEQPFFFTTPAQRDNRVLLRYQQRFVDRLLEATLAHGHVLYCIDNETKGEEAWGAYWAGYLDERARARGRQIFITEMWDDWDIKAPRHRRTLDHPERYAFVDLSQNNHNTGVEHWRNAVWAREYLASAPRPINTVKTYGADGNKFGHTDRDGLERFFRHVLAGFAAARFHRPDSGLGLSVSARAAIAAVRRLEQAVTPWSLRPRPAPADAGEGRVAYVADVAASEGGAVAYFPQGGSIRLDLPPGTFHVTWIDGARWPPPSGTSTPISGPDGRLAAPGDGHWMAAVVPAAASASAPGEH